MTRKADREEHHHAGTTNICPHCSRELLSPRQCEVIILHLNGFEGRAIAQRLYIALSTVKIHLREAYAKIGSHLFWDILLYLIEHGFLPEVQRIQLVEQLCIPIQGEQNDVHTALISALEASRLFYQDRLNTIKHVQTTVTALHPLDQHAVDLIDDSLTRLRAPASMTSIALPLPTRFT